MISPAAQLSAQLYKQDFSALYGAATSTVFQDASIAATGTLVDQSEIVADKKGMRLTWTRPDLFMQGLELTTGLDWLDDNSRQHLAAAGRTWVPPLKFNSVAPLSKVDGLVHNFLLQLPCAGWYVISLLELIRTSHRQCGRRNRRSGIDVTTPDNATTLDNAAASSPQTAFALAKSVFRVAAKNGLAIA